jgi:hypothetical protein
MSAIASAVTMRELVDSVQVHHQAADMDWDDGGAMSFDADADPSSPRMSRSGRGDGVFATPAGTATANANSLDALFSKLPLIHGYVPRHPLCFKRRRSSYEPTAAGSCRHAQRSRRLRNTRVAAGGWL